MRIISIADAPPTESHRDDRFLTSVAPEPVTKVGPSPTTGTTIKPCNMATTISTIPAVVLETDVVSDNMATRLCISFLGHVMFLKNQIPFPIVQLARVPTSDDTTRTAKKRHELLNSFDTLASHLYTTFIALSTALALRSSPEKPSLETAATSNNIAHQKHGSDRAFFAVALGPSVGAAKTRVIVGIDGLETKVWGLRSNKVPGAQRQQEDDDESDDDNDEEASQNSSNDGDSHGESEGEEDDDGNEEDEVSEPVSDDSDASPPPSRSPSPCSSSDSSSNSPDDDPQVEDPESLRAAERLLARTLAAACAEDDGHGLASEMAPTQIHVLLRAPRRFAHPAWTPRQNLCASWDNYLSEFLQESGESPLSNDASSKKRAKASKVQGIWVRSRGSDKKPKKTDEELAEEDELIWWSWDGKLVGFVDW